MNTVLRDRVDALTKAGAKAALQQLRQAVQQSQKNNDNQAMAWALLHTGMVLRGQRKYASVSKILVEALNHFSDQKNELGEACALYELSVVNRECNRNTLAFDYGSKAVYLFQSLNRTIELAWAYSNLALICFNQSRRAESLSYAKKAHAIFLEFKSDNGLAWNDCTLASIFLQMGYLDLATSHYKEALELFEKANSRQGRAWALLGLGTVQRAAGDIVAADATLTQSKNLFSDLEISDRFGWCLLNLAAIKYMLGNMDEAIRLNKEAIQIFTPLRNHDGVGWGLFQMAQVYRDHGRLVKAWQTFREAFQLHTDASNRTGVAWGENAMGEVYREMGDLVHARECLVRSRVLADQLDIPTLKADVERNTALLQMEEGLIQKADETLESAESIAQKCESRITIVEILLARARLWLLLGDSKRAREAYDTARGLADSLGLQFVKPRLSNVLGEIFVMEGQRQEAIAAFTEAAALSKKMQQRRHRAEALLGAIQLQRREKNAAAIALSLFYIEKDVRAVGSRKLRARFLAVKGLLAAEATGSLDNRFFNQGIRSLASSGLNVFEKQILDLGMTMRRDNNGARFNDELGQQLSDLMKNGPVDLHLVRPRTEWNELLPVSVAV